MYKLNYMSINDILLLLLFTKLFYRIVNISKKVDLTSNKKYTMIQFERFEPEKSSVFKTCATPHNCFSSGFC